ncbi:MAG: Hsp70 family protein [Sandaracinaceae bacterium]|nr:Hsp70 family protein [Sandaracinaceae bacterium]
MSKQGVLLDHEGEQVDLEADIGRADWEDAVRDLVDTTIEHCRRAVAQATETAGIGLGDIDHVVLVGGSTRVPLRDRARGGGPREQDQARRERRCRTTWTPAWRSAPPCTRRSSGACASATTTRRSASRARWSAAGRA